MSGWSSDVCSSDLRRAARAADGTSAVPLHAHRGDAAVPPSVVDTRRRPLIRGRREHMSVKIFDTQEVQDFLRNIAGLDQASVAPRTQQIMPRALSALLRAIDDLDTTTDDTSPGDGVQKSARND